MASPIMKPFSDLAEELTSVWSPAVDIYEDENLLNIVVDLPGVDPKLIDMKIQGDMLWLRGERKPGFNDSSKLFCAERVSGPYLRTVVLPAYVDTGAVKARCENGVLTVTLPKKAEAKPRQIAIEGE